MTKIQLLTGGVFPPNPVTTGTEGTVASASGSIGEATAILVGDGAKKTWVVKHSLNTTSIQGTLRTNTSYKEEVKANANLIAYYRMNSAAELKDEIAVKAEGTLNGSIPAIAGALTKGGEADKANEFKKEAANFWKIASGATKLELKKEFTIECFVFPKAINANQTIFEKSVAEAKESSFSFWLNNVGRIILQYVKGGLVTTEGLGKLATSEWQHIAISFENASVKSYIGGRLDKATSVTAGEITSGAGACYVGETAEATQPLNSNLDELAIYSKPLTEAELTKHFNVATKGEPLANVPLDATHKIVVLNSKEVEVTWEAALAAGEIGWVTIFG